MRWIAMSAVLAVAGCGLQATETTLPSLRLDPERVSVVGLSSGAAMAQQAHFAYSDKLVGAGLVAGPPYGCAEGDLNTALGRCMKAQPDAPDANKLAQQARELARQDKIAPLSGLGGDKVLVLHGKGDAVVAASVAKAAQAIYEEFSRDGVNVAAQFDGDRDFSHTWPTQASGKPCDVSESPFVGSCGFDAAAAMLETLYGKPSREADTAAGKLVGFDQRAFKPDGKDAMLADEGLIYVPPGCADGNRCGVVFAFHGCDQNVASVGESFVRDNGLNRWADVYGLVIVYPQTRASFMPLNPKACWDWWGYTGADYATRDGVQLRWLANLSAALGVPLAP